MIDLAAESNAVTAMPPRVRAWIARTRAALGPRRRRDRHDQRGARRRGSASATRGARSLVVPNIPEPADPALVASPPDLIRAATGLPASTRIVLFHGRLGPDLGLESAAEAVLDVPDAALVLLGFGRGMAESRARDRDPRFAGRHLTLDARPPDELVAWTASADVCLIPLPPVSANQRLSTPNKFWEAVGAGTPLVVVAGMTMLERLVREGDLGAVAASRGAGGSRGGDPGGPGPPRRRGPRVAPPRRRGRDPGRWLAGRGDGVSNARPGARGRHAPPLTERRT